VRKHFRSSMLLELRGFLRRISGVMVFTRYALALPWRQSQIAGISLSPTSVAVAAAFSR
jgi:hypothetical protein